MSLLLVDVQGSQVCWMYGSLGPNGHDVTIVPKTHKASGARVRFGCKTNTYFLLHDSGV